MFQRILSLFRKVTLSGVIVLLVLVISLSGKYYGQASSGASIPEVSMQQKESANITEDNAISLYERLKNSVEKPEIVEQETPDEQEENELPENLEDSKVKGNSSNENIKTKSEPSSVVKKTAAASTSPTKKIENTPVEKPEAKPEDKQEEVVSVTEPKPTAPVTFSFGSTRTVRFRSEVEVTNNGSEVSRGVQVSIPMLENNSPYQKTSLTSTSYPVDSKSGRVSTFKIGNLEPGETKTIVCDYSISIRPVSINSTNDTVEKAREAYNKYAGSGNCHTLAVGFVNHCKSLGLKARVVTGFARPQRGNMTSGSLAGCRHSWAEFYVDGLGWVPVDLTFKYFGSFPHASHVVETYNDQSIRVRHSGGSIGAVWKNSIL